MLTPLTQDLRQAVRSLRAHPGFSLIAIASLAIGVSTASGIVTILDARRGDRLSFPTADRVVALYATGAFNPEGRYWNLSPASLGRAAAESRRLAAVAVWEWNQVTVRTESWATLAGSVNVSASFPRILGLRAALGRTFTDGDERPGAPPVAVLSHRYWVSRFGSDSTVVGRSLSLDGRAHEIVGVMAPEAEFPARVALWVIRPLRETVADTTSHPSAIALLAPGATAAGATAELSALGARAQGISPRYHRISTLGAAPFGDYLSRETHGAVLFLTMVGIVVALIAAVNFAALVLARGIRRRDELGIRAALGASTSRLVWHLVAECVVLSVAGGALGAVAAPFEVRALNGMTDGLLPPWVHPTWGIPAALVAVGCALLLGVVFGLAPAVELARPAASGFLRGGSTTAAGARRQRSGRRALVALQVALATGPVVFVAAMFGGFLSLRAPRFGFDQSNLFVGIVGSTLHDSGWKSPAARASLLDAVHQANGVVAAGVSQASYLRVFDARAELLANDSARAPIGGGSAELQRVSPGFFAAFKPKLLAGRLPSDEEVARGDAVGVVTEGARRAIAGNRSIGWRLDLRPSDAAGVSVTVVGVIADVRRTGYEDRATPLIYTPLAASEAARGWSETLWIRGVPLSRNLPLAVYAAVRDFAPAATVTDLQPRAERLSRDTAELRSLVLIAAGIFGVALTLAALGIYGIIAYSAVMRRKEVAIRLALGASRTHVAGVVVREAARQVLIGLVFGVVGGTLATALMPDRTTPVSVPPVEATLFTALALVLTLVMAAVGPVWRVWREDFAGVLREEG